MGKSSSAPATPDPSVTSAAQAAANQSTAITQSKLNNTTQYSPTGASTYSYDPSTGTFTNNVFNTPSQQALMEQKQDTQANFGNATNQTLASYDPGSLPTPTTTTPVTASYTDAYMGSPPALDATSLMPLANTAPGSLDYSSLTAMPSANGSTANPSVQQAQSAAFGTASQYVLPALQRQQGDLTSQLSAQGIPVGSDAYNRAMTVQGEQENQAVQGAANAAVTAGDAQQQAMFGEGLQSRQQGVNEQVQSAGLGNQAFGETLAGHQQGVTDQTANANINAQYIQNILNQKTGNLAGQQQTFQQQLAANNQNFSQASAGASLPVSLASTLAGATPNVANYNYASPAQTNVAATNTLGAQQESDSVAQTNYQTQQTQSNQDTQAAAQIAAMIAMAALL